jgi:hypothetical protein
MGTTDFAMIIGGIFIIGAGLGFYLTRIFFGG